MLILSRSVAPAALLPIMTLNHAIFTQLAASSDSNQFPSTPLFQSLCLSATLALDGMLAVPGGGKKQRVKPTLRKAAVLRTRRVVRNNYRLIPSIFDTVYDAYADHGSRVVPMLGVIFAVSLRLKVIPKKKENGELEQPLAERFTAAQKDRLFDLYLEKIMSSKTPVPKRIYAAMDDLWSSNLIGKDVVEEKVLPMADKLLIRSPEVVLPSEYSPRRYISIGMLMARRLCSTLAHHLSHISRPIVCHSGSPSFRCNFGIEINQTGDTGRRSRLCASPCAQDRRCCKGQIDDRNLGSAQNRENDER